MSTTAAMLAIVVIGIGTFLIRFSGILLFSGDRELSPGWARTLELVGPAAMAAIVANTLILDGVDFRDFGAWHLAAIVAAATALWKRDVNFILLGGALGFLAFRLLGL
jgi:branched-subunit amino acid transport protein